jgi:DNA-binding NtrC family response regulator
LSAQGYQVATASDGAQALEVFEEQPCNVVFADLKMPGMSGMDVLENIKRIEPDTHVVIMTGYGTIDTAVACMKMGAYDFILKPFDSEEFVQLPSKIMKQDQACRPSVPQEEQNYHGIIYHNSKMAEICDMVQRIARTNATVLISGESGTGKELIANAIHQESLRQDKPFFKVNCGALSPTIIESELFGHEKGSFTGAHTAKKGRFEIADGGTLFLDEIGEISPDVQVKLLRVLQEKEFERVGGVETIRVDVRLIAASNRDLEEAMEKGTFRKDLFYRLNVVPISLPPIRERTDDIELLVSWFLRKYSEEHGKTIDKLSAQAMEKILSYPWPGNVRELQNVIERAVILAEGHTIGSEDLLIGFAPFSDLDAASSPMGGLQTQRDSRESGQSNFIQSRKTLGEMEKELITLALQETDANISQAAKRLDISRGSLYSKIKKHGLDELVPNNRN